MSLTAEEIEALDAPWKDSEVESLGARSALEGGGLFCGVTEQEYAINGVTYQWPRSIVTLRWGINFARLGRLSDMDFKDSATAWLKEMADACNRVYEYTADPSKANILYAVTRLDGPRGVLARMRIPVGNVSPATQLVGEFDDSEAWVLDNPKEGEIDLYAVGGHETQHAEGLGHLPSNVSRPARIAAMYDPRIRYLQPETDVAELVRRNGPRVVAVPPATPPAVPVPGALPVNYEGTHRIEQSGKVWEGTVKGVLARVK